MATGLFLFNEVIDDKRLGLWLKSALESKEANAAVDRVKSEMIRIYIQTWKFIYSIYHGKCLAQSLANLYGGAGDIDPLHVLFLTTLSVQSAHILMISVNGVLTYGHSYWYC